MKTQKTKFPRIEILSWSHLGQRCGLSLCAVFFSLVAIGAATAAERQIAIPRVDAMPDFPKPFEMRDWRKVTLDYVGFVTDFEKRGDRLPVIGWANSNRTMVTLPSYVGGPAHPPEGLNFLAMIVSGSLAGLDMRSYRGIDWVAMATNYFSETSGVIVNNPHGGTGGSFWYDVFPGVLFCQICALYPGDATRDGMMRRMAEQWRSACIALGAGSNSLPDFDHTGFNLQTVKASDNGHRIEPEGGAGIAWIEFMAWKKFGDAKFLEAADWSLRALEAKPVEKNPLYEVLLPYGAIAAARMNEELGRHYDVSKFVNWCFEPRDRPQARPFWGVIADRFGSYDCAGLVGSSKDSGGYAFAMNTFEWAGALAPLARHDPRYARAIGKWLLNLANASRLFYANALPADHQDHRGWSETIDVNFCVAYEGLRKNARKYDAAGNRMVNDESICPYATGDAVRKNSGALNLCLYGSSHAGLLGGMISPTDVEGIVKIDLLKTDWFHDAAEPAFLIFNPFDGPKTIAFDAGNSACDMFDRVTGEFIRRNVHGPVPVVIAAKAALLIELKKPGANK